MTVKSDDFLSGVAHLSSDDYAATYPWKEFVILYVVDTSEDPYGETALQLTRDEARLLAEALLLLADRLG